MYYKELGNSRCHPTSVFVPNGIGKISLMSKAPSGRPSSIMHQGTIFDSQTGHRWKCLIPDVVNVDGWWMTTRVYSGRLLCVSGYRSPNAASSEKVALILSPRRRGKGVIPNAYKVSSKIYIYISIILFNLFIFFIFFFYREVLFWVPIQFKLNKIKKS